MSRVAIVVASKTNPSESKLGRFAGSDDEPAAVHQAYALMRPARLFGDLLASHPEHLAMWPLERVLWSGLGSPERVAAALAGLRGHPGWAPPADPSAIPV